jgi:predicted choloylglycine hydrolase
MQEDAMTSTGTEQYVLSPAPGITEIACSGSSREMGIQQGQALREQAHRGVREVILENDRVDQIKPPWIPRRLFLAAGRWVARRTVAPDIERSYPDQHDRIVGIAQGAGLDIDSIWMTLFVEQNAMAGLRVPACTSIALQPERTTFNEPAICRNFDLPPETRSFNALRRDRPAGRYASLSLTFPQLPGSHTGINERGLAISYNLGYPCDKGPCRASVTLIVQEVLERCRCVDEAADLIARSPHSGGALLTLADETGRIAVVELTGGRTAVRPADAGAVVSTNHYVADATRPMDTAFSAHAWPWQHRGWYWIGENSQARRDRANHLLATRSRWDLDGLISILADHGDDGHGTDMTICRHPPPYETTFAAILLPARREILLAPGQACCRPFVRRPLTLALHDG